MPTAISIRKVPGKPGQVWYPLDQISVPDATPGPDQVVIRMTAAALNHRDLFLRQHLYPGTTFGVPLLADGCGIVESTGSSPEAKKWHGKRVVINPGSGWKDDPEGPEDPKGYAILGGTKMNPLGTLTERLVIGAGELEEAPRHLSSVEAAALPLTGLTAWRATVSKSGNCKAGRNILVTGIGGGVALMALAFASAAGANVFVTSGSEEKIEQARKLGAKGGVNYKTEKWDRQLLDMLPKERKVLDAIIDGAGGDIVAVGAKLLRVRSNPSPLSQLTLLSLSSTRSRQLTVVLLAWRSHCIVRNDHKPQNALPDGRRAQEHRPTRLDDGIEKGIRRHGQFRLVQEGPARCITDSQWSDEPGRNR